MRQADEDAYAEFVRAQHASLFRTAYLLTGDYQRAEDLVQTAFVKVYLNWGRIQRLDQPGAYARKIVVNQTRSWFRRRSSRETVSAELSDRPMAGHAQRVADRDATWSAVLQLPPRQRAVIVLRFYEDLSEADTADILGMALGTVKSHCHAATQRLATLLEDPYPARTQPTTGGTL